MDKKSKIFDKAQKYIQKGYLDRAIDEYRKVLRAKPGDVSTRLRVGDLFVKIGREDEAIKEYHEVARTLTQNGFYLKAIAVYKQILKLDPPNLDMRYRLAELYARQDLIADAISEYDILARHFESKGKREDALNIIKKMLEIDRENVGIRLRLAEIYEQSGFQEDAAFEFANAAERLVEDGKIEKAEKLLLSLYNRGEKQLKVLEGLVAVAKEKGERTLFLRYSRELIALYDKLGEVDKERELSTELLTLFPDESDVVADMLTRGDAASIEDSGSEEGDNGAQEEGLEEGEERNEENSPLAPQPTADETEEEEGESKDVREDETEETPQEEAPDEPLSPWSEMVEIEDEPESSDEALSEEGPPAYEVDEADSHEVGEVEEVVVTDEEEGGGGVAAAYVESTVGSDKEIVKGTTGAVSSGAGETAETPTSKKMEDLFEGLLEDDSDATDNSSVELREEVDGATGMDDELLDESEKEIFDDLFEGLLEEEAEQDSETTVTVETVATEESETDSESVEKEVQSDVSEPVEEIDEASLLEIEEEVIEKDSIPEPENREAMPETAGGEAAPSDTEPAMAATEELDEADGDAFFDELPDDLVLVEEFDKFEEDSSENDLTELLEDDSAFDLEDNEGGGGPDVAATTVEEHEQPELIEFPDELPDELEVLEELDDNSLETVEEAEILPAPVPEPVHEESELEIITVEEEIVEADGDAEVVTERAEAIELPDEEEPANQLSDEAVAAEEEGEGVQDSVSDGSEAQTDSGYVDLSSELGLGGVEESETVIEEFNDGIERQLNREDTETHYNMGIAYMEMEMYDEAVREFNIAVKDPNRLFDCQIRLGLSYMVKGEPMEAIASYSRGLDIKGRTKEERKGLMYELALAYESAENDDNALKFFKKVKTIDNGFRDVAGKMRRLKEKSRFISIDDSLIEVELL